MKKAVFFFLSVLALVATSCSEGKGSDAEPYIKSISTQFTGNKAVAGKPVTLNGENFSPVASENVVFYGVGMAAKSVNVDKATATSLVFTAPKIDSKQVYIRVSTNGIDSNSIVLEYTESEDDDWDDTPTIVLEGAVTKTIRPGVEWTSYHGLWAGQMRNINIVRTKLDGNNHLGIYYNYQDNGLKNLDQKCEYLDALIGTNGPMACCQFVRVDGTIKRVANDQDYFVVNCALTIDGDVVDIVKVKNNYDAANLTNRNVGCAGPLLVWNGKVQSYPEDNSEDFLKTTHPRTAIGISKDGKTIVQVAIDGRYTTSDTAKRAIGMSTQTLSAFMKGLGCYKAMNFDGGGGTAMWVYGEGDGGIVNHPCDNSDWDHPQASLRATGNAVYVRCNLK